MDAYGEPIMAFALWMVRDRELAKDIRQEVFLKAFQKFHKFKGERGTLWGWLRRITDNQCKDELRRHGGARAGKDLEFLEKLFGQPDTIMDVDRIVKRRALEHCLRKLSDSLREQLLMRFYLGMSYAEIGERVGDASTTVQVRICRLLQRMRTCLRKKGFVR